MEITLKERGDEFAKYYVGHIPTGFFLCSSVLRVFPQCPANGDLRFKVNKHPSKKRGEKRIDIGLLDFVVGGQRYEATTKRTRGVLREVLGEAPDLLPDEFVTIYVRPILPK